MKLKLSVFMLLGIFMACSSPNEEERESKNESEMVNNESSEFQYEVDRFADVKIIRYQIPGWDSLSIDQKKLVYYLSQAGYCGRDIIWDQNYRHNLAIRKALETIYTDYSGDRNNKDWENFETYTKRVWFSNGIHHHYSNDKFLPEFSLPYFTSLLDNVNMELNEEVINAMFNPEIDAKKVSLDPNKDLLLASASNFYAPDISEDEAIAFYSEMIDKNDPKPISYGLNSKLVRDADGNIREEKWTVDGMYGDAIKNIVYWLKKATEVAENKAQKEALELLIAYYQSGDLKTWDDYSVAWVEATEGDVDYINGFIEVYNDPIGYRGSYETMIEINDFEASERMKIVSENVQWFEDQSPIMDEHKKENVKGVSYKVVNIAAKTGDAAPSGPIGVNLPNANWIRAEHGSKSVSLHNIVEANDLSSSGGLTDEFAYDEKEKELDKAYSSLASSIKTALHEVVGHASGQLNPGVGTPKETLKNYASTLEEARADLVALYFTMDEKLIELGLIPSLDVAIAQYDAYILNGLMLQLRRIELGNTIEEAHMRNRQLVASWAYEQGLNDNVIEKIQKDGKTYYNINDYQKLREIFGKLLREIQRIKSEGDYDAGRELVEAYGVQVDEQTHIEVLERVAKLNTKPYSGNINPKLVPVLDENEEIIDVKVEYPSDFPQQMLDYSKDYGFLMP
jgi:dipeptidyl-peptidase-3